MSSTSSKQHSEQQDQSADPPWGRWPQDLPSFDARYHVPPPGTVGHNPFVSRPSGPPGTTSYPSSPYYYSGEPQGPGSPQASGGSQAAEAAQTEGSGYASDASFHSFNSASSVGTAASYATAGSAGYPAQAAPRHNAPSDAATAGSAAAAASYAGPSSYAGASSYAAFSGSYHGASSAACGAPRACTHVSCPGAVCQSNNYDPAGAQRFLASNFATPRADESWSQRRERESRNAHFKANAKEGVPQYEYRQAHWQELEDFLGAHTDACARDCSHRLEKNNTIKDRFRIDYERCRDIYKRR